MAKRPVDALANASNIICLKGQLTDEGTECQAFRAEPDNDLYSLVGDLGGFVNGDAVVVCGTTVAVSFCQQGITLALTSISRPHGFKDTKLRLRNVEVKATRSSADHSPVFKLEGKPLSLNANGSNWEGAFADVAIEGPLQVFFQSGGWKNQKFDLTVTVKHPSQPGKDKKGAYQRTTVKGIVTFDETLELA